METSIQDMARDLDAVTRNLLHTPDLEVEIELVDEDLNDPWFVDELVDEPALAS